VGEAEERRNAGEPRHVRSRALAGVCVLAAACATIGKLYFREPDVQLKEIQVTGIGLSGGTLALVFDAYNPNDYRLRSTRLELGLDLEGKHFGDALLERPLDLSPANHTQVVVPVRFEWAGAGAGARALLSRQGIRYGLSGTVFLDTPLGDRRVTLHANGDVPLKKLIP